MSTPILLTKTCIPLQRPELVHRLHLIEQLDNGLEQKLTLISAPAGFGKTTLVTDWLQTKRDDASSPFYIAWLSLDEGDNDPVQFLIYLIAALIQAEVLDEKFGNGLQSMLQSPQPPPLDSILISLINEISISLDRIIIIFDDYHRIQAQPVDAILAFFLENLPSLAHLVITTREDPNLPFARLRARNQLSEIRASDLLFSSVEVGDFLNQVMKLNLSADDIALLETRTEGWIAGLQLAAISMRGRDDVASFIQTFSGSDRLVFDYLIEEVINQQPEDVQSFLLQTAILNRLSGSLCNAVTGQNNGQAMIEMLDRTNLFVIGLDSERKWYRYHHLFADFLIRRLRQTQLDSLPEMHIRASEWFNQQGANREAIKHSIAAKDFEKASKMVEAFAIDILQQGEHTSVTRWINEIPDELVNSQPYLSVLHAWALLLSGQLEAAESRLQDAEKALDIQGHKDVQRDHMLINGLIHTNRAYLSFITGKHEQTISYARRALKELPESASLFRAQTGVYLGVAYRYRGQLQAAFDTYNEILPITQQIGGKIAVQVRQNIGDLLWHMAKLTQAQDVLDEALQITEQHAGRPDMPYCGFVYMLKGRILYQRDELAEAHQIIKKGFTLCRDWNLPEITGLSYIELANIQWALGNFDQARKSYQEAIQIFGNFSLWGRKYAEAYQAKLEIVLGNVDAAERWAQSIDLVLDSDFEFHREMDYLALARLLIVQKKFTEAHSLVERISRIAEETGYKRVELESLILLSLINYGQGDVELALKNVQKALIFAKPEGFIRIFVDEGPPMAKLLYQALSREIAPAYVKKLLAAFPEVEPEKDAVKQPKESDSDWIEPLSDRELEVLQLIAEGLSRQEIASQLVLSLNTVKTHARNIFSKLGVNNQMQAVGKARGLGLLDQD